MKKLIFLGLLLLVNTVNAQTADSIFTNANKLYQEDHYADALSLYKKIEDQGLRSDKLYYNIANANYKLNKVAPAIYYYEKAMMLNPNNEDARFNLEFARRMALDNIEPLPKTFGEKLNEAIVLKLTYNQWAWTGVALLFFFAIVIILYYFSYDTARKRLFFLSGIVGLVLALISLAFAYKDYSYQHSNNYAIVFAQKADVKTAPTLTGEVSFELHEGTKVKLLEKLDNWVKIKIADGKIGWIVADELREL